MRPKSPPLEKHPVLNKVMPENANVVRQKAQRLLKVMSELMAEKFARLQLDGPAEPPENSAQLRRYPLARPSVTEPNSDIKVDARTGSTTPASRDSRAAAPAFVPASLARNAPPPAELKMSLPFAQSPALSVAAASSRPSDRPPAGQDNPDKNAHDAAFSFFKFSAPRQPAAPPRAAAPAGPCLPRSPPPPEPAAQPPRPGSKVVSERRGPPIIRTVVRGNPGLRPPPVVLTRELPVITNNVVVKSFDVRREVPVVRENAVEKPCELLREVAVERRHEKEVVTEKHVTHPRLVFLERPVERILYVPVERTVERRVFLDRVVAAPPADRLHSFSFSQRVPFRSLPHSSHRGPGAAEAAGAPAAESALRLHSPQQSLPAFGSPPPKRQLFVSELNVSSPPSEPRLTPESAHSSSVKSPTPSAVKTARFASRPLAPAAKPESMSTIASLPPDAAPLLDSQLSRCPPLARRASHSTADLSAAKTLSAL